RDALPPGMDAPGKSLYGLSSEAKTVLNSVISTSAHTLAAYGQMQTHTGSAYNGYAAQYNQMSECYGCAAMNMLGTLGGQAAAPYAMSFLKEHSTTVQAAYAAKTQEALDLARSNDKSKQQQAVGILVGLGYRREDAEKIAHGAATQEITKRDFAANPDKYL